VLDPEEVDGLSGEEAALLIDGTPRISKADGRDYGVVVAKRMTRDQTVFVVAGNRGPGTFAAARCLANGQITASLPSFPRSSDDATPQPVLVAVVSTSIRANESDRSIDKRMVGEITLEAPPTTFTFSERKGWEAQS
jgi:hypothetical protein